MAKFLLDGAAGSASSGWVNVSDCLSRADQQDGDLWIGGVFNGASVAMLTRPRGSTRDGVAPEDSTFTAGTHKDHSLSPDIQVKFDVTGGDGSTSIDVWIG